jgi:cation diffusion facilitator family transporter
LHGRHAHASGHHHEENDHGHDSNFRAAYLHVLADAMTSVLAIMALLAGRFQGWVWMDPVMGIVAALVIAHWSFRLLRSSSAVLLDTVASPRLATAVREQLELGTDRVADLHVWRLGPGHTGVIASIVSHDPKPSERYKERLRGIAGLSHVTIEVHACCPTSSD